ncbi:MAG TPA: phosphatase PAP2 family protein [Gemmatirosa sp.]
MSITAICAACVSVRSAAWAQADATPAAGVAVAAPRADSTRREALVRGRDVVTLGAFAAAALAVAPADRRIARWSQRPSLHDSRAVDRTASFVRTLGGPGTVAIPLLTYGVGLVARDRGTAAVGLHAGEAVFAASIATTVVKVLVGRARPYVSHDSDATSFAFGRGLRRGDAYESFPSGHATASFALATALAGEGQARWPRLNRVTAPLGFGIAALVGASRIYHDAHWASDVLAGAGVGTVVGGVIARYGRTHPDAALERRLLPSVATTSRGTALGYAVRF